MMGVMHANGWNVPKNESLAVLNYYFASLGGHVGATLALAYRHQHGFGVPQSCESSLLYYEMAAQWSINARDSERVWPILWDQSPATLGSVKKMGERTSDTELVEYYQYLSDKGDSTATHRLASIFYYGIHGESQDLAKAFRLFTKAHELGSTSAVLSLGHMYQRGLGVEADDESAAHFFELALEEGNQLAHNALGELYLDGYGTQKPNAAKALQSFKLAAKHGISHALYNIGLLHLGTEEAIEPNYEIALHNFLLSHQYGNIQGTHKVALMTTHGIGLERSCDAALILMQKVALKGPWIMLFEKAQEYLTANNFDAAFLTYLTLAEQGYETAQFNVAYLLDLHRITAAQSHLPIAVHFYRRAASLGNVVARLKLGDYYYFGRGGLKEQPDLAMEHYRLAAARHSSQAMYNLGTMYETGVGVAAQDYQLAKRWYDSAITTDPMARFPVNIALFKLSVKSWWRMFQTTLTPSSSSRVPQENEASTLKPNEDEKDDDNPSDELETTLKKTMPVKVHDASFFKQPQTFQTPTFDTLVFVGLSASLLGVLYYRTIRQRRRVV